MATTAVKPKSKMVAYLLWFFLGWCSAHKFYLGKTGMGILYLLTAQLAGIGWIIDLFTLGNQVDLYNALHNNNGGGVNTQQNQNVVVNVTAPAAAPAPAAKVSADKQILALSQKIPTLTIKQIVSQTDLEMDEAEEAVKKLVAKGMAKEQVGSDGKMTYDFS
ncbi:MAG: TM2 domain-containing protein [Spirochaetaceae bacterium]|jgi:TM2 domain-containing membrane protein YozV|nr:TM2 domain-containing protein [Spirochaetaceae bacterium]